MGAICGISDKTISQYITKYKLGSISNPTNNKSYLHLKASAKVWAYPGSGTKLLFNNAMDNLETNIKGIFAAGDAEKGASLVVHAIEAGKVAARNIDEFLKPVRN